MIESTVARISVFIALCLLVSQSALARDRRGVDFRVSFDNSNLAFRSATGSEGTYTGRGLTAAIHFYLYETERFRTSFFTGTRYINYGDTYLGDLGANGLQVNGVVPGLEFSYRGLYFQVSYPILNINEYAITSTPVSKALVVSGIAVTGGLGFKFRKLGIFVSGTQMNVAVPAASLNLQEEGYYRDSSVNLVFVYYLEQSVRSFFKSLF